MRTSDRGVSRSALVAFRLNHPIPAVHELRSQQQLRWASRVERPQRVETVWKRKSTRFSGVALPFQTHCQADTARSEGSPFSNLTFSLRFHTTWVGGGPSSATCHRPTPPTDSRRLASSWCLEGTLGVRSGYCRDVNPGSKIKNATRLRQLVGSGTKLCKYSFKNLFLPVAGDRSKRTMLGNKIV